MLHYFSFSSPIIQRVGATKTYVFSSLFTIVGALMIALPDSLPGFVYIMTAIFIISLGVGPATNATFQNSADWSPIEPSTNLGTVNGLVGQEKVTLPEISIEEISDESVGFNS